MIIHTIQLSIFLGVNERQVVAAGGGGCYAT